MLEQTKGIVLKNVAYGETSVIATIFTEQFGLVSYMVNGARSTKKTASKANMLQPGCLVDMIVYHQKMKNLQRIKEIKWLYLYKQVFFNVYKNTIALYMAELLLKTIKLPETNSDLFQFIYKSFVGLDECGQQALSNYPIVFSLHLASHNGLRFQNNFNDKNVFFDLQEGAFCSLPPNHPHFIEPEEAKCLSVLLKNQQTTITATSRQKLLNYILQFFALHQQDFGQLKSVDVLHRVFHS